MCVASGLQCVAVSCSVLQCVAVLQPPLSWSKEDVWSIEYVFSCSPHCNNIYCFIFFPSPVHMVPADFGSTIAAPTVMEYRRCMEYRIRVLHFSGTRLDMYSPFFFFGDIWSIEYVFHLTVME